MKRRILFIDRDGTLIEEPPDEQIDAYDKLALVPGVIPALLALRDAGYEFVMVSNQDGLGTERFPQARFDGPHRLLLQILESQGITFAAVHIDPSLPEEHSFNRKPQLGMVLDYLKSGELDLAASAVIGDRETDLELARNMGIRGLRLTGDPDDWSRIARELIGRDRVGRAVRRTAETEIEVTVNLDGTAAATVNTGIGFFDHMLEQLARHGGFQLELACRGDLHVDDHHTIEDCALALGQALRAALGDRRGIGRYGFVLPMDETRAQVAVDLGGRPWLRFEGDFGVERVGGLATEMVPHFFRSLADTLGATIHIQVDGDNGHHMVEACFKGLARALRPALARTGESSIPSTKGVLA